MEREKEEKSLFFLFLSSKWYKNIWFVSLGLYSIWILLGLLFYRYVEDWTFSTAYYYTIEAGLSIGFCYPAEREDDTRLFTVFYVLLGSSVVVGSLAGLGNELLGEKKARIVEREHNFIFDLTNSNGILGFISVVWYNFKILVGWYKYRRAMLFFIGLNIWFGIAILFGMLYLKWTFVESLYFAVTTISTGGLQGPPCINGYDDPHRCEFGTIPAVFTGIYAMIGIPLYFLTLGIFAGAVINHALKARHKAKLYSPIEARDFIYATKLLSDQHSTTLSLGEFILLELMRVGATDRKQIDRIRLKFHELDIKKNEVLDYDELCQGGYLIQSKTNSHLTSIIHSHAELIELSEKIASPLHPELEQISPQRSSEQNPSASAFPSPFHHPSYHLPDDQEHEMSTENILDEIQTEIQHMRTLRKMSLASAGESDLLGLNENLSPLRNVEDNST